MSYHHTSERLSYQSPSPWVCVDRNLTLQEELSAVSSVAFVISSSTLGGPLPEQTSRRQNAGKISGELRFP